MEIRNPEYIIEIARQKNVTRAAEKLFLTQPTLSQYLSKLEDEVGMPLFLREKEGLIPTDAGRICLQAAQNMVRIQESAQEGIAALRGEGNLRIGCSAWGTELVMSALSDFKGRFPGVTISIYGDAPYLRLRALLRAGRLDLAIIAVLPEDDIPQGSAFLCRKTFARRALSFPERALPSGGWRSGFSRSCCSGPAAGEPGGLTIRSPSVCIQAR